MKSFICASFLIAAVCANDIFVTNNCNRTIWVGIVASPGKDLPDEGGFALEPTARRPITVSSDWVGRIWGRTNCNENGTCETGDCEKGIQCNGNGPKAPVTVAEVTLGALSWDFYDVSLADGHNVPISFGPANGTDVDCDQAGCVSDLNEICPPELSVTNDDGETIGCSSFCGDNPNECEDSEYVEIFRQACPHAYVHSFDDAGNLLNCESELKADLEVIFCP